jgi:hypothetical protein
LLRQIVCQQATAVCFTDFGIGTCNKQRFHNAITAKVKLDKGCRYRFGLPG